MTGDVLGPQEGKAIDFGGLGVRFPVRGEEAGGAFALVEHPSRRRALAAPLHRHSREDEFSYVVEGRMGALLGDRVVEAGLGDFVFRPPARRTLRAQASGCPGGIEWPSGSSSRWSASERAVQRRRPTDGSSRRNLRRAKPRTTAWPPPLRRDGARGGSLGASRAAARFASSADGEVIEAPLPTQPL